jgi:hypothetical protein
VFLEGFSLVLPYLPGFGGAITCSYEAFAKEGRMKILAGVLLLFASCMAFGGESPMHGYLECQSAANQDTIYFSAIFEGSTGEVGNAFRQFLGTKYGYKGTAGCSVADMSYSTIPKLQEGHKAQVAQWRSVGKKVVDTGWIYGGATAQGNTNEASPKSNASEHELLWWCFALVGSSNTMYVTKGFQYPLTLNTQPADKYFGEFIRKTYGSPYSPTCQGGRTDAVQLERGRQDMLRNFTRNPRIHIVEVEWMPPSPTQAAPAAVATHAAPPKPTQMTYEQALEAERPHSMSPAPTSNSAANAKTYTFCYSTGSPYRGTAKSHYYATGIFAASNSHADGPFGVYLHKQHPDEDNHAQCILPGPMSTVENTRRTYIENEHKSFPNQDIVELSWKPTT